MAPSIIFFDEIDALAPTRSGDTGSNLDILFALISISSTYLILEGMGGMGQRVLSQLLNEMDGISARTGVLLLACSSRPDLLDPALLRPGRLERLVYLGPPNAEARAQLLRVCSYLLPITNSFMINVITFRSNVSAKCRFLLM